MTDKEKVLAQYPQSVCLRAFGIREHWVVYVTPIGGTFGSGPTESEAWANAAKGLE